MLGDLQGTLADMRAHQALQLALQREQLDLQRQQLVKTNLLLQRQGIEPVSFPSAENVQSSVHSQPRAEGACPYKGLAAFGAEDVSYFFGREELVAELTARLAGTRFLAVVGPSGSGKSSIVRAGLLPAIWGGALPGSRAWQTLVLTPGAHPLEELAIRVSLLRGVEASALLDALSARPEALHLAVQQVLADEPSEVQFLLVVDQFEEIFALCHSEMERRALIEALLYAVKVESGRTVVVLTIRADFYGRCAEYPDLAALMSDGLLVGPMSVPELQQAIECPARIAGLRLEPGLAETIIGDVADEPGALPLLSHALLETFARRQGQMLTLSGYAASGGVAGAIAQTADAVYDSLDDKDQVLAQSIFLQLTELGEEGSQDTRRRVAPAELVRIEEEGSHVTALLHTLADARLVTMGGTVLSASGKDPGGGTVEVAHEALIREWGRLRDWLDACRDDLRAHRRLTAAAAEWIDAEKDEGYLLRGSRLSQFEAWASETEPAMTPMESDYLQASVALRERRQAERERERAARARAEAQARRSRQLRRLAVGLAAVLVLAIAATVFALAERGESQKSLRLSESHRLTAASINSLGTYPERSVLLALEAMRATYADDGIVAREADSALRRAMDRLRLRQTLFGHNGPVYGVSVSPNGECWATASADRTARVWDAETGEELAVLSGHAGLVRSIAFGPLAEGAGSCGAHLATAGEDGSLVIWSLASVDASMAEELLKVQAHPGAVWSVAFSPDGARLATSGEEGAAKVWDSSTGQELWAASDHTGAVYGLAFSADGRLLATAGEEGIVRVWSISPDAETSPKKLRRHYEHEGPAYAVAFSPDGTRLAAAGGDGVVKLWSLSPSSAASGEELASLTAHNGAVSGVLFSPDGTRLASTGEDETARVWAVGSGSDGYARQALTLVGHTGAVHGAAFSPDGSRLVTASEDRTAKVWDVSAGGDGSAHSGHDGTVWTAAFSPDGTLLATAGEDASARIWSLTSGSAVGEEMLALTTHTDQVSSVAFNPQGTGLATASDDGTAKVWAFESGASVSAQELFTLSGHAGWVMSVAYSPDGTRLATASLDGTAKVWALASSSTGSDHESLTLSGHTGWVSFVAFSPDGSLLATAGYDGTARVWDAVFGQELHTLSGHSGALFGVAFSPDGTRLATASEDGTARVWSLASAEELLTLSGHTGWVLAVAYSPDGTRLATVSADGTVRIWDTVSGEELLVLSSDADLVNGVAFSPDGARLVATGSAGMVRIYVLDADDLMAQACDSVTRNLTEAEWQTFLGRDVAYRRTCPDLPMPPAWLTYGHLD
jgi:WD40 repeat protein